MPLRSLLLIAAALLTTACSGPGLSKRQRDQVIDISGDAADTSELEARIDELEARIDDLESSAP